MPDAAVWLQDDLCLMVPWLLKALAESRNGHPASAERLIAAAMQLLPPLLDGLHARMDGLLEREWCADVQALLLNSFFDTLVGPGAAFAGASALVPCAKLAPCSFLFAMQWRTHALRVPLANTPMFMGLCFIAQSDRSWPLESVQAKCGGVPLYSGQPSAASQCPLGFVGSTGHVESLS